MVLQKDIRVYRFIHSGLHIYYYHIIISRLNTTRSLLYIHKHWSGSGLRLDSKLQLII